jgi:hypothetical protein
LLSASGYRFGFMAAAITMLIVTIGSRLGLAVLSRNDRRNGMVA